MKIRIFSDLHLEFLKKEPDLIFPPVDLVILAGDIHMGEKGVTWARGAFPGQPVVYVMGNHEYYESSLASALTMAREECRNTDVHLLEQDALELPSALVLGCTLWTDFMFKGGHEENACKHIAKRHMNDYRTIYHAGELLNPDETQRISRNSFEWLDKKISEASKPVIVVTHHGPSTVTRNPNFVVDHFTPAYVSNYDSLVRSPVKLWVTGHTHHCNDIIHNGVRMITHQMGYPKQLVGGFDWDKVFEVEM